MASSDDKDPENYFDTAKDSAGGIQPKASSLCTMNGFPALEAPQNEFGNRATGRETPEILVLYTTKNRLRREGEIETPLNNNGYQDHMLQL